MSKASAKKARESLLAVGLKAVASLVPYARNARTHTAEQVVDNRDRRPILSRGWAMSGVWAGIAWYAAIGDWRAAVLRQAGHALSRHDKLALAVAACFPRARAKLPS
jgi:hypothetical protein